MPFTLINIPDFRLQYFRRVPWVRYYRFSMLRGILMYICRYGLPIQWPNILRNPVSCNNLLEFETTHWLFNLKEKHWMSRVDEILILLCLKACRISKARWKIKKTNECRWTSIFLDLVCFHFDLILPWSEGSVIKKDTYHYLSLTRWGREPVPPCQLFVIKDSVYVRN